MSTNDQPAPAQGEQSPTPRTDAVAHDGSKTALDVINLSRSLERELSEANCAAMSNADAAKMAEMERDTLRQQLAAVTKERDEAREQWRMSSVCRELQAKLTAAESELAELRKDRARLDWLEGELTNIYQNKPQLGRSLEGVEVPQGSTLRAAIDAARQQEGRE